MVAELLEKLFLVVILSFLSGGFVISGSSSTLILLEETMLGPKGLQPSTFEGGLDDLENFQAWAEEIRTYMSSANPPLYEVLGQTASSKVPIDEDGLVAASQDVLRERAPSFERLQAKIARSSMTELAEQETFELDETDPT